MITNNIDLMKIGNIRTKAALKKYKLNKPLMNGNYLFHYLILTNNLKGLKLYNHPINKLNNDNLTGLMLAAREKKYKILDYLLKKYKDKKKIINQKNKKGMTFLHYMNPNDTEYLEIIENNDIDWTNLYQLYSTNHITGLDLLFIQGKYNIINTIINKIDFNYKSFLSQPYHFNLIVNNNLKNTMVEKLLDNLEKIDPNILKYTDDMGYDISFPIVLNDDFDLVKYIVNKRGSELDRYSPISTSHIFVMAYKQGLKDNNYKIAKYLLDHIMKNHNFDETDMYGNNMAHFILKARLSSKKGNYDIEKEILSQYKSWGKINMDKKTPLDYIVNLDYKKYHEFVKNRTTNLNIKLDKKWKSYIEKLPIDKDNINDENLKLINSPYAHSNMFQARFTDIGIFSIYLKEKYKDKLFMPIYKGADVTPDWNDDMLLPDNMLYYNNNFPWIIIWNDENNYWIHPHLNDLINKNKKSKKNAKHYYDASFAFLSMRLPDGGLHAALIFYDFTRNQIQRFDPYGDTTVIDGQMDEIFKEKLAKPTHMDYCGPDCYFPVSGFQTLSDENNSMNQKMGDFGGYCLAWSIWYVEHKMINLKVEPKDLIRKTINRFMKMNVKPMEYIRNYANHISKFRIGYLKKIGVPENIASNENLNNMYTNIINNSIINY